MAMSRDNFLKKWFLDERLQYLGWFRQARKANFLRTNLRSILSTVNSIKKKNHKKEFEKWRAISASVGYEGGVLV